MKRYAIIPTRETEDNCQNPRKTVGKLNRFLTEAGWVVYFARNADSMLGALREGLKSCDVTSHDYIIFCHDDIEILNNKEYFNAIIDSKLSDRMTGFIGCAGTAIVTKDINWFACSRKHNSGGGMVYHGKDYKSMYPTSYGAVKNVVTLDGVFLAATGKVFNGINLTAPKSWVSKWHHYDTFLTLQTHVQKKINRIAPLSIRHESGGDYNKDYVSDIPRVARSFNKYLPASQQNQDF
tara:strand:- start:253 stop:963 length:711 start_codon:yes stop_codon:yes gene_type:complete